MAADNDILTSSADKKVSKMASDIKSAIGKVMDVASDKMWNEKHTMKLRERLEKVMAEINKANLKGDQKRADELQKRLSNMHMDIISPKGWKDMAAVMANVSESFGEGLHDAFKSVASKDVGVFASMFKKAGAAASKHGARMEANAGVGAKGDMVAGLGQFLSKMGPLIVGIGAVAGGLAALAKVILDSDAKVKELNKEILGSGLSISDFASDADHASGSLKHIRNAFTGLVGSKAFDFVQEWGVTAKENLSILNSLASAGYAVNKQQIQSEDTLRSITSTVMTYSKILGESNDKVASDMGDMMQELGTGLGGVRDRFADIADAARESGFGVKRFYGMVLQTTTGMSMYNVRLNQTVELLSKMGKMFGAKQGAEFVQSQMKGFRGSSTKERVVSGFKMGGKAGLDIATGEAHSGAAALQKIFTDALNDTSTPAAKATGAALAKAMADYGLGGTPAEMAEKLSKMDQKQMQEIAVQLTAIKDTLGAKFTDLWKTAQGMNKGIGNLQLSMTGWGAVGTMLAKMKALQAIPGMGNIADVDYKNIPKNAALDELGGMSQDELDKIKQVAAAVRGLQFAFKSGKASPQLMKMFNVESGAGGKLKSTVTGEEINIEDFDKLFSNYADVQRKSEEEKKGQLTRDQELAKATADATTGILDRMDSVVEGLLTSINSAVMWIASKIGLGDSESEAAKSAATDDLLEKIEAIQGQISGSDNKEFKKRKKEEMKDLEKQVRSIRSSKGKFSAKGDVMAAAARGSLTEEEQGRLQQLKDKARARAVSSGRTTEGDRVSPSSNNTEELAKQDEVVEKKFFEKRKKLGKNQFKEYTDDMDKVFKEARSEADEEEKIASSLRRLGVSNQEDALSIARQIKDGATSGFGMWESQAKTVIKGRELRNAGTAEDGAYISRSDGSSEFFNFSSADDVSVTMGKRGGPISRAGSGGGGANVTVYVQQWGDVPQAIRNELETLGVV